VDSIEAGDRALFAACGPLFRKTPDTDWELLGASGTTIGLAPEWIALDPTDDATLYAWAPLKLIRSHQMGDNGTWETVLDLSCGAYGLAIDHETGQNLYLATYNRGVMVSRDHGESWQESNSGLPGGADVGLISIAPSDPDVLWIAISPSPGGPPQNVYKTTDAGRTWAAVRSLLFRVNRITIDPSDADVVYLGQGDILGNAVDKTSDGGVSFVPLWRGLQCRVVHDIAIDPKDTRIVYAATGVKNFMSLGAGLYSLDTATGLQWNWIECPGVDPIGLYAIAFDPWVEGRVLCAFASHSLLAYQKPTAAHQIELSLSTGQSQYAPGDIHVARISASNSGGDIDVDLYIAIMLPEGSLLFWPDFSPLMHPGFSMTPMPRGFSMSRVVFFNMALPGSLPGGNYTWFGIFYGHGAMNALSNLASAGWTFLP
jgi:photosystem II stability/assembly factor-like uncharacterized protein